MGDVALELVLINRSHWSTLKLHLNIYTIYTSANQSGQLQIYRNSRLEKYGGGGKVDVHMLQELWVLSSLTGPEVLCFWALLM